MKKSYFILADLQGRALSVCSGTIKTFDSYEEARRMRGYGGSNAKFVGIGVFEYGKLISKTFLWEDGMKNWHSGESLQAALEKSGK